MPVRCKTRLNGILWQKMSQFMSRTGNTLFVFERLNPVFKSNVLVLVFSFSPREKKNFCAEFFVFILERKKTS